MTALIQISLSLYLLILNESAQLLATQMDCRFSSSNTYCNNPMRELIILIVCTHSQETRESPHLLLP